MVEKYCKGLMYRSNRHFAARMEIDDKDSSLIDPIVYVRITLLEVGGDAEFHSGEEFDYFTKHVQIIPETEYRILVMAAKLNQLLFWESYINNFEGDMPKEDMIKTLEKALRKYKKEIKV